MVVGADLAMDWNELGVRGAGGGRVPRNRADAGDESSRARCLSAGSRIDGSDCRARAFAAAGAFNRRAFHRPAHSEAVVRWEAELRAAGERFGGEWISAGGRAAGCVGWTQRCGADLRAAKTFYQRVCVAGFAAKFFASAGTGYAQRLPVELLARAWDGVLRGFGCQRGGPARSCGIAAGLTIVAVSYFCWRTWRPSASAWRKSIAG